MCDIFAQMWFRHEFPVTAMARKQMSIADNGRHGPVRPWIFWLILILLVAGGTEAAAFVAVRLILAPHAQYLLWNPDLAAASRAWAADGNAVDDQLGWPPPGTATSGTRDTTGAKINADFPETAKPCVSAYGDSFVWGDQVPAADGWVEQLSRQLGCRVSNYGVSGYGTDQAYIRFHRMEDDHAPVVLLGIFPDDIIRNLNQYRAFLGFGLEPFWVKGRFVLDEAKRLQWIPRPRLDAASYLQLHRQPAAILPHEYFLPDSRDGQVSVHFPYTPALVRLALMPRLWNRLRGQTPWTDLYSPDHPSGAVPLTIAIAKAFVQEAQQRGMRTFIVMLPSAGSFRLAERSGKADYAPFVTAMTANGLSVFDPIPGLIRALKGQSYCMLYVDKNCEGHYNIAGGGLVAQIVAAELKRLKLVDGQERSSLARHQGG